ncbi:MAG: hypothetical protein A2Z14_04205 [Chloroflexi bacterium RBG_16_48_8]|nr:MAG: hypothetical protein A2Z14_04205 [Chloroflexi bacterium RBG_16_48_8]
MHSDPLIKETLEPWMPSFLHDGIYYYDILLAAERMQSWDDWGSVWIENAFLHETLATKARESDRRISAVQAFLTAARYYHMAYFIYTRDLEVHNKGLRKMLECYERVLDYLEPPVEKVTFPFEDTYLVGLFSNPFKDHLPPVVILIPGLDSTKESRHRACDRYLRRGMAVLSIDGPGQGETSLRMSIRFDYEKVIAAAIDYFEARGDVDINRIRLMGSSLGGYYAPRAAAFETRVKACVGSCGPYDWSECFGSVPHVTREAYQLYSGAKSLKEVDELSKSMTLRGTAEQITCPLLTIHGKRDALIPWEHGKRIVNEASGPKEFVLLEEGNHSLGNISYRSAPVILDWLAEQIGGIVT